MEILGGIIAVIIMVFVFGSLLGGACTTLDCKKDGQRAFDEMSRGTDLDWQRQSRREDVYYEPDPHAIIAPNYNFYSDGSLKHDPATGRSYPKGQYFCDSHGLTAGYSKAPGNLKRPPKN